jgi:UDP-GlcNAc3NAcA epimerase
MNGDLMRDVAIIFSRYAKKPAIDLPDDFILCTLHRQENTDNELHLTSIMKALNIISEEKKIIMPVHPRTQKKFLQLDFKTIRI